MAISKSDSQKLTNALPDDGIGIRIKSAREAKKLSQTEMHNMTGLSRTVLINYEAGRHKPSAREIKLICDALEISPNYLIYGTEEPHKKKEGLAHTVLGMGEHAFVPLTILVPLLAAVLGYDEKRKILEFVETTIKAQSPELLADVMSVLNVVPKTSEIDLDKAIEQSPDPERSRKLMEELREKLSNLPKKS